jgi:hypothetical protein
MLGMAIGVVSVVHKLVALVLALLWCWRLSSD